MKLSEACGFLCEILQWSFSESKFACTHPKTLTGLIVTSVNPRNKFRDFTGEKFTIRVFNC